MRNAYFTSRKGEEVILSLAYNKYRLITQTRVWINIYKSRNNLITKTKLGNIVNTDSAPACPVHTIYFSPWSLLLRWLQHAQTWGVVSACVCRLRETNFSIFCSPIISTPIKVSIGQGPLPSCSCAFPSTTNLPRSHPGQKPRPAPTIWGMVPSLQLGLAVSMKKSLSRLRSDCELCSTNPRAGPSQPPTDTSTCENNCSPGIQLHTFVHYFPKIQFNIVTWCLKARIAEPE
jgi:hypothetical protein